MPAQWVDIDVGGQSMEGYLTASTDSTPAPAVVVIQEIGESIPTSSTSPTGCLPKDTSALAPAMFHRQGRMVQCLHEEMDTALGFNGRL